MLGVTSPHTISSLVAETEYEVQWRAVSSAGDGEWSPSGTITTAAVDLMPSLPTIFSQSATVGTVFSLTFDAATGGDPPLTYSLSGNPAWLTLSGFTLSGTPDATGAHQVRVTVEDDDGDTAFRAFILSVSAAADLTPSLPAIDESDGNSGYGIFVDIRCRNQWRHSHWLTVSAAILLGFPCRTAPYRERRRRPERTRSRSRSRMTTETLLHLRSL